MKIGRFFAAVVLGWAVLSSISLGYSGWIAGKVGNALAFDGTNDYVEVAGYQGILGTQSRTCCAWIKTTAVQQGNIVSWGAEQNGQRWTFRTESDGTLGVGVYGGIVNTTAIVNDGQWHHVAAVLHDDGSPSVDEILLYIDGVLQSVTANSTQSIETIASQDVVIGAFKNAGVPASYFNGLLDEVCIYGRALVASEINPEAAIPTDGLVAHWAMGETEGKIAHDYISSYNGTLINIFEHYSGGSGTSENPYQISDIADWQALMVNSADWDKHFIMIADIDLGGQVFTTAIIAPDTNLNSSEFQGVFFTGTFDGDRHKITNFTINGGNNDYLGLFGYIHYGGKIRNLGLENYTIIGSSDSHNVGSIAGFLNDSGCISNCYSTGSVSGYDNVGGLVGEQYWGSINNCYVTGPVNGTSNVGGLVGYNYQGYINNCYSISNVNGSSSVGGLVGFSDQYSCIISCYSVGPVNGTSNVGGFLGQRDRCNINNCFWDTQTSGQATSAGGSGVQGKTTIQMHNISTFINARWDFIDEIANGTCNYWKMPDGGGYPVLTAAQGIVHELSGGGMEGNPYVITNANDLGAIWYRPSAYYILNNNIDLIGIQWGMAVVPLFNGVLDGNGFCIKNLSIQGEILLGFLGWIESGGQVKNISIKNCIINGSSYSYSYCVGGLAGYNYSSNISNCYSTGSVSGCHDVGGLVGGNLWGYINNCFSTCRISSTSTYTDVGGLAGSTGGGKISGCFWDMQTSGQTTSDGGYGVQGKTTAEMQTLKTFTDFCWVTGKTNNALRFGGDDDYMIVPTYYGIGGSNPRTVSLWIKASARSLNQTLVDWGSNGMGQAWNLLLLPTSGKVRVNVYGGEVTSTLSVTNGQWHHIAAVLPEGQSTSNQILLYIDGQLDVVQSTFSCTINTSQTEPIYIGVQNTSGTLSDYFMGLMDDICIYDRSLSSNEIGPEVPVSTTGLVVRWMMDESEGTVAYDSMLSYDGQLKNMSNIGWDFTNETTNGTEDIWRMCVDGVDYPRLNWESIDGDFACPDGVGVEDLDYFVGRWLLENCTSDNNYCGGGDVDASGTVDLADYAVLAEHWLEGV